MKKIILASLAVAALVGCEKESSVDSALLPSQNVMNYAPYAGASATKGTAVNDNADFCDVGAFEVAAYSGSASYFGFSSVTYDSAWKSTDKSYWPNHDTNLHFGAYSPVDAALFTTAPSYSHTGSAHALSMGYNASETVADQVDLMYALTDYTYDASEYDSDDKVNLHFKHALTQVAFKAKSSETSLDIVVKSIKICNVLSGGTMTATAATTHDTDSEVTDGTVTSDEGTLSSNICTWSLGATQLNYAAAVAETTAGAGVTLTSEAVALTSDTDVLMLAPQSLTAWDPTATTSTKNAYLAIGCKITHKGQAAAIIDGTIYVPFSTANIDYDDTNLTDNVWNPGYKITYTLNFGGGYIIPGGTEDPEPGKTPEGVEPTLREISYTVSVDAWTPAAAVPDVEL